MYAVVQHPFITYAFVLSSGLALLVAAFLRLAPPRGGHRAWLYAVPLVVPVLSYAINYLIIGKACDLSYGCHSYVGGLRGFPSYHLLCRLNYPALPWISAVSLAWLVASLVLYGLTWCRTRRLVQRLPVVPGGDTKARLILGELCRQAGVRPPVLRVVNCARPLAFAGGIGGDRVITLSKGTLDVLEDGELRAALAHELAHIRRMGHVLNWFLVLCRDLTLFSPASLWSYAALRREEEETCDFLAASQYGLGAELASAIVKLMRHGGPAAMALPLTLFSPAGDPGAVRVKRLLDTPATGGRRCSWAFVLPMVLLIGLAFIC